MEIVETSNGRDMETVETSNGSKERTWNCCQVMVEVLKL